MQTAVNNIKSKWMFAKTYVIRLHLVPKQIFGVMVESHLVEGRQDLVDGKSAGLMDKVLRMRALDGKILKDYCNNFLMQLLLDVKRRVIN